MTNSPRAAYAEISAGVFKQVLVMAGTTGPGLGEATTSPTYVEVVTRVGAAAGAAVAPQPPAPDETRPPASEEAPGVASAETSSESPAEAAGEISAEAVAAADGTSCVHGSGSPQGLDVGPEHRRDTRDAAHNDVLDAVRAGLVAEAQGFALRVSQLQDLARLVEAGAARGVPQFSQLEMAGSWSISQVTATRWADDARHYTDCLPMTLDMLSTGTLLLLQAQVLLYRTRNCPEDVCRRVEAEVLPQGAELCPSDLRKLVDLAVLRIESDLADPTAAEKRHAEAVAGRRVWSRPEIDGMGVAGAVLSAEQLRGWQSGMDLLERRERIADRAAGVERSADQRRADLFAALPAMVLAGTAQDRAAGGPWVGVMSSPAGAPQVPASSPLPPSVAPAGPPVPWTFTLEALCAQIVVNVHVPVSSMLELSNEPGTMERYGPISAEHIRLVRPHSFRRVLVDAESGVPLAVDDRAVPAAPDPTGRRDQVLSMLAPTIVRRHDEPQHDPSAGLARLVDLRDALCCGPGCSSSITDLDHLVPWPAGPTSEPNLGRLSRRCHRAKHAGWTLVRHPDGRTTWTSPLSRTYSRPGPHRPPPRVDLTQPLPPLRPAPESGPPRWVMGKDPKPADSTGAGCEGKGQIGGEAEPLPPDAPPPF